MQTQELEDITVTKTYTLTLDQVRKLEVLEPVLGKKKSELVRDAIDDLYDKHFPIAKVA